jgi:hypothetical protein
MSTIIDSAREAIEARIASQWANSRIRWPNVPYAPPNNKSWLSVSVLWGDGFIQTKNGRNTVVGVLDLNVYVPVGQGDGTLAELCDDARDMVNRLEVSGVRFDAPSGPRLSVDAGSKWRQGTISCSFSTDEEI